MKSFQQFQEEFNTPIYSRKELNKAIEDVVKSMTVNRVIQHVNGRQDVQLALQILAIHQTHDGITVIVK